MNNFDPSLKKFHNQIDANAYEHIPSLLICTLISDLKYQGLFLTLEKLQVVQTNLILGSENPLFSGGNLE